MTLVAGWALGLGSAAGPDVAVPTRVGTLAWSMVSAGGTHACGISAGALYCWGGNSRGQLGDASITNRPTPTRVGSASDWSSVSAGVIHTCGRRGTTVYCWGGNNNGQLGNGNTTEQRTPIAVGGAWSSVVVGEAHACALDAAGAASCWGSNGSGQLGLAGTHNRTTPTSISGDAFSAIDAGGAHTCAIRASDRTLFCAGANAAGQLGDGTTTDRAALTRAGIASDWAAIAAGTAHTCGLNTAGALRCFGSNASGEVGLGSVATVLVPTPVAAPSTFDAVAAGGGTCASGPAGVHCFGPNRFGELGANVPARRAALTEVAQGHRGAVARASFGERHGCLVRTDGSLWCSGDNASGQLGLGDLRPRQRFTRVGADSDWTSVTTGQLHTCALRSGGRVFCWGDNAVGQVGDGTTTSRSAPVEVAGTWDRVVAGHGHTCGLRLSDRAAFCWGDNANGRLGDGTTVNRSAPVRAGTAVGYTAVAVGEGHSCALLSDGGVDCWGFGGFGALARNSTANSSVPVRSFAGATAIAAGASTTCALDGSAGLWCWGLSNRGQAGRGQTAVTTPTQPYGSGAWTQIAMNRYHTCGVRSGAIACFGSNSSGQLGDGTLVNRVAPVVAGALAPSSLALGFEHTCAVRTDGTLVCVGYGGDGQLGDGRAWAATSSPASCALGTHGCAPNAACIDEVAGPACVCPVGFGGDATTAGSGCTAVNACATNNGGCAAEAICAVMGPGTRTCACPAGYSGDGLTCTPVDACATANGGCSADAVCTNTGPGTNTCACNAGYSGDGVACDPIDSCLTDNGGCAPQASCTSTGPGTNSCACNAGYSGDGTTCTALAPDLAVTSIEVARHSSPGFMAVTIEVCNLGNLFGTTRPSLHASQDGILDAEHLTEPWAEAPIGLAPGQCSNRSFYLHVPQIEPPAADAYFAARLTHDQPDLVAANDSIVAATLLPVGADLGVDSVERFPSNPNFVVVEVWFCNYGNMYGSATPTLRLSSDINVDASDVIAARAGGELFIGLAPGACQNAVFVSDVAAIEPQLAGTYTVGVLLAHDQPDLVAANDARGAYWPVTIGADLGIVDAALLPPAGPGIAAIRADVCNLGSVGGWATLVPWLSSDDLVDATDLADPSGAVVVYVAPNDCSFRDVTLALAALPPVDGTFMVGVVLIPHVSEPSSADHAALVPGVTWTLPMANCGYENGGCSSAATCGDRFANGVTCRCNPGYQGDGVSCTDVDECLRYNGGCSLNAACTNTSGSRTCACAAGYSGDGVTCADVDECLNGNGGCSLNADCTNTIGSRTCACAAGYTGDGVTCTDVDECATGNGGCAANAACTNTPGSRTCACAPGYSGDGLTCADVNECLTSNGGCDPFADCTNTPGARSCACGAGFTGDGITCADIDECLTDNGGCSIDANCNNDRGSRWCSCRAGYTGDGVTCTDINECATNNGGCATVATCTNTVGSRSCACPEGFSGNGLICTVVLPTLTSVSPSGILAGSPDTVITVTGTDFTPATVVYMEGQPLPTVVVSPTQMTATVVASRLASVDVFRIWAERPGAAGPSIVLHVQSPQPTITSVSPTAVTVGTTTTLTINGTAFTQPTVSVGGVALLTTPISSTRVTVSYPASLANSAGVVSIVVNNRAPSVGPSNSVSLTINNAVPSFSGMSPALAPVGAANTVVAITGSNFVNGLQVTADATILPTTFISATQAQVTFPASLLATARVFSVGLTNPAPNAGMSVTRSFNVNNPVPTLATLQPSTVVAGTSGTVMDIVGTDFLIGATVNVGGFSLGAACSVLSSTLVRCTIPSAYVDSVGTRAVTVRNVQSAAESAPLSLSVIGSVPTVSALSPASVQATSGTVRVTVTGAGFSPTAQVSIDGLLVAPATVQTTQLTVDVATGSSLTPRTMSIAVINPAPGGGTSAPLAFSVEALAPGPAVMAGVNHQCRVYASGTVSCSGDNASGQLGDGTTTNRSTPVTVSGVADAVEVCASRNHTCVRRATGGVACWGSNLTGELGNGTRVASSTPVQVTGLSGAVEVACGGGFTCARLSNGTVQCWGANQGILGTSIPVFASSPTPIQITGVSDAAEIDAGTQHVCIRHNDAGVSCWGGNFSGELGLGLPSNAAPQTAPTRIPSLSNIVEIAAAYGKSCARSSAGTVFCWGGNNAGELGDGTTVNRSTPVQVATNALGIALGYDTTCIVGGAGDVRCAGGYPSRGEMGNGSTAGSLTFIASLATNVRRVVGGNGYMCAVRQDATVVCWGSDFYGAMGRGTTGTLPLSPVLAGF